MMSDKIVIKIKEVSVTTDIWSSQLSTDSYLGITAHFINTKTRMRQSLTISKWE